MNYSSKEKELLVQALKAELRGKLDGGEKNIIAEVCPYCGKKNKFGVYVGKETDRKKVFSSHCFSCGASNRELDPLLEKLGRQDLILTDTSQIEEKLNSSVFLQLELENEIDDSLDVVLMPDGYKRCFKNPYLKERGFITDDYDYFPCGTTRGFNFKFDDYVIFPIIDESDHVGYVARHTWSKKEIEAHNRVVKRRGKYQIMRYRNSLENDFVKLVYNYDSIIDGETDTVIIVEGVFDVIALTRKLELYDNKEIVAIATFGKKISNIQIYKLQTKGVRNVVLAYDGDAVEQIKETAGMLSSYFNVLIADLTGSGKDFDEMDFWEVYDTFAYNLKTPREYRLNKLQV